MLKRYALFSLALALLTGLAIIDRVQAASNYSILSNAVYFDKNTMTKSQIQKFLEDKGSTLATYKDKGVNDSKKELASTIIYNAAKSWEINPQIIIATLQKEQSLITKQNPTSIDYRSAMGYGCPDSAACNSLYYGFANQVNIASYQFRYNYEALKGNTSFVDGDGDPHGVGKFACNQKTGFYNKPLLPGNTVTFKRNTAISGTKDKTVTIANEATASFLCYTPHVGPYATTGYSGSDNFIYWFEAWFGSTQIPQNQGQLAVDARYTALDEATNAALSTEKSTTCKPKVTTCWKMYQGGAIIWSKNTGAWESYGDVRARWAQLGYQAGVMGYPTGAMVPTGGDGYYQRYQTGYIIGTPDTGYWESKGSIRPRWAQLGYQAGVMGYPTGEETRGKDGSWWQKYQNGYIIGKSNVGFWESRGPIRTKWASLKYQNSKLGYPTGAIIEDVDGNQSQSYQHGVINYDTATKKLLVKYK